MEHDKPCLLISSVLTPQRPVANVSTVLVKATLPYFTPTHLAGCYMLSNKIECVTIKVRSVELTIDF